jgi:hypothetical protein
MSFHPNASVILFRLHDETLQTKQKWLLYWEADFCNLWYNFKENSYQILLH